jgi:glyoxylase-like metal-dependent hydrolase (beta-lactamase superfamily II)/rhodanese-related sulfurtransferase
VVYVEVVSTEELGDRSYVAHDAESAIVIDPQRDIDRIEHVLAAKGLDCVLVLETHLHNDYVSGGLELARRTGGTYFIGASESVAFRSHGVSDGDELQVGRLRVRVVATPGHTDGHLAYVIDDGDGTPVVFTGGSLLYGSVGRTDLVDPDRTDELTRAQYHSAHRLADLLPDETPIYPTHGFGSFCSSGSATGGTDSTIGIERASNDALTTEDEDAFVAVLVAGLTAYPSYYVHMGPLNAKGPGPIDLSPPEAVDGEELARRITAGEWVVDLRSQIAYAAAHLDGSIGIGLGQHFATYLGWLIPWGTPLTLLGESTEQITAAQRQLVRIGIDRPNGAAVGTPDELAKIALRSYPTASFDDLAQTPDVLVLDVRRDDERARGHIPGSAHVPLHSLLDRLDELPDGRLWVHCASGYRASIAASLLDRAGRDVVLIDDDFEHAGSLRHGGAG